MPRIGNGKSITAVAPVGGVVANGFYSYNGAVGMAMSTVGAGQEYSLEIEANARYSVLVSPVVYPLGAVVYFDKVAHDFVLVDTADSTPIGICDNASSGPSNAFTFTRYQGIRELV